MKQPSRVFQLQETASAKGLGRTELGGVGRSREKARWLEQGERWQVRQGREKGQGAMEGY